MNTPPVRRTRAISRIEAHGNGMCSKTWPESTTSWLLLGTGILYGCVIWMSTLRPAWMSTPV